jgi:hypothetical protein
MIGWKQTTEERYWDILGCVPPIAQRGFGFLVGEAADHRKCKISGQFAPRYDAFIEINGRFFESVDPITVLEWMAIKHSEIAELNPAS